MLIQEASEAEVAELRTKVLAKIQDSNKNIFYERDITRIQNDDIWMSRFILHQEGNVDRALEMVIDSLKWRKDVDVLDLKQSDFPPDFCSNFLSFSDCRDKENCRLMTIHVRSYQRDRQLYSDVERYCAFEIEKAYSEEKGHPITVVFDMRNAGWKNMDLEMLKYFVSLFKYYYPCFVGSLIVYEISSILKGLWNIVKLWLNAAAVRKVKFVNKDSIQEFINADQLSNLEI